MAETAAEKKAREAREKREQEEDAVFDKYGVSDDDRAEVRRRRTLKQIESELDELDKKPPKERKGGLFG